MNESSAEWAEMKEHSVRFSFKYCDCKEFCVSSIKQKEERSRFYSDLGKFESMNWGQLKLLPREKGISVEKKGDPNYILLEGKMKNKSVRTISTPILAHMRFGGQKGRIFGFIYQSLFYVVLVDATGSINHK